MTTPRCLCECLTTVAQVRDLDGSCVDKFVLPKKTSHCSDPIIDNGNAFMTSSRIVQVCILGTFIWIIIGDKIENHAKDSFFEIGFCCWNLPMCLSQRQLEGHAFSFLPTTNWTYIQNKSRVSFHYFANFWRAFINADENKLKNFKQGKHAKTQFVRQKDVRDKVELESHVSCQTSQIDDVQYCRSQRSVWCQRYICDQMLRVSALW